MQFYAWQIIQNEYLAGHLLHLLFTYSKELAQETDLAHSQKLKQQHSKISANRLSPAGGGRGWKAYTHHMHKAQNKLHTDQAAHHLTNIRESLITL